MSKTNQIKKTAPHRSVGQTSKARPSARLRKRAPWDWHHVTVTWHAAHWQLPDSDTTVLIHRPSAHDPVWMGYHDSETWRQVDGEAISEWDVMHWADLPVAPRGLQ